MTRHGSIFLPEVIDVWRGIDNWISGDRDRMKSQGRRYPHLHESRPAMICWWIKTRLARSGRVKVSDANAIIYLAAKRYSGAPWRTYEASSIEGMGYVVNNANKCPSASFCPYDSLLACDSATDEAQEQDIPHSDRETRMFWLDGRYQHCQECRWCGEIVQAKEHWKERDGSVRCNRRDCRRMDYLRFTPQSRGGIDLTPRQRRALSPEAWDTQRSINYLALVAKEAKHGRNANHDVRRHPASNHRHHHAGA